jgi:uncharacterized protein YigE (DUF2233 family)
MRFFYVFAILVYLLAPVAAAPCETVEEAGKAYAICAFDARKASIRLFLRDEKGDVYGSFSNLAASLQRDGDVLLFAMNAGMYDENRFPIGLYIEAGKTLRPANTHSGRGNFHMKPNGVFWIDGERAGVTETSRFLKRELHPAYATQSGPMLVAGGRINPHIHDSGVSQKIRNGVCAADGHIVRFVISNAPVTFHEFAHLFRERLHCADALYLDGSISSLYAPSLSRHDRFMPMGPIVGVVDQRR